MENGRRIETLARQKKQELSFKCYAQKELNIFHICTKDRKKENYLNCALERTERGIRRILSAASTEEEFMQKIYPLLDGLLGIYAEDIKIEGEKESYGQIGFKLCRNKGSYMAVKLTAKYFDEEITRFGPIGGSKRTKKGFWYYRSNPGEAAYLGSFYEAVTYAAVLSRLQEALWELSEDPKGRVYCLTQELVEMLFEYNYQVGEVQDEFFEQELKKRGYKLDYSTLTYKKEGLKNTADMDLVTGNEGNSLRDCYLLYQCLTNRKKLPIEFIFQKEVNARNGQDGLGINRAAVPYILLNGLYLILLEEYENYLERKKYERLQNKNIATAYMTKKNIPQIIVKEMENSLFNRCFGFVEFDEEVELKAVQAVAREFTDLNDQLFGGIRNRDCAIRFRKLGKHRASGLYYPKLNCMCVDIRTPDSFIHEYYHLLDDQMGLLSEQYDFYAVCKAYQELFNERLRQDKALRETLSGGSKYNAKYYLQPVEIFARCGEMYLQRIKKVQSSLLKPSLEESFAYPSSEQFDGLIQAYFDEVHRKIGVITGEAA